MERKKEEQAKLGQQGQTKAKQNKKISLIINSPKCQTPTTHLKTHHRLIDLSTCFTRALARTCDACNASRQRSCGVNGSWQ